MSSKYEKYSDEVRELLSEGNTAYFCAKHLLEKYADDNLVFVSAWKFAKDTEVEMNEEIE